MMLNDPDILNDSNGSPNFGDSDKDVFTDILYLWNTVPTMSLCYSQGQEMLPVTGQFKCPTNKKCGQNMFKNTPNCDIFVGQTALSML
jgi:hypothetical protein